LKKIDLDSQNSTVLTFYTADDWTITNIALFDNLAGATGRGYSPVS